MYRIVLFLVLIALAVAGGVWVADQTGDVVLLAGGAKVTITPAAQALGIALVAALLAWLILGGIGRVPGKIRRRRHEKRQARGRHAITQGLLAVGHGDATAARMHAETARKNAGHDPLALLLHAQTAQLSGDREGARTAFHAMAERADTRLLGLRGLFIEAQRADDPVSAVMIAEEALKLAPASTWASHAVLGFRCAKGDWSGALAILDNNLASGLIDKPSYRRQRGVLLTARALELETVDRDLSRDSIMEAVRLAPTLVPAAVLAGKYESEAHQVRRAMRIVETAWLAQPHPDLADAYAHVRLGNSARQRLVRVETLAAKMPDHPESALAIARAAIDASEFVRARAALEPLIASPTQRVALLMAEIERTEHGDSGRARAWTLRAVRARHDPAWTADGYVSDKWRPVSPVSGRLDAFQWQTPVASLPSDKAAAIEAKEFNDAMMSSPRRVEPPRQPVAEVAATPAEEPPAAQDNSPAVAPAAPVVIEQVAAKPIVAPEPVAAPVPARQPAETPTVTSAPLFRARTDLGKTSPSPIPQVIPIIRAPDDPGIDEEAPADEFSEQISSSQGQTGGWRGFLARWGG